MSCSLCDRVQKTTSGAYSYLIHEFKNSYLYLGEHQFYKGYCVLVTKNHYREMTDIPTALQVKLFEEMMIVHSALERCLGPKKMNMCSLGNVVDHVHWHFFPRYANDPNFKNPPWLQMHLFDTAQTTETQRVEMIDLIRSSIPTKD